MTFEEFKELALNTPIYKGETIYLLNTYCNNYDNNHESFKIDLRYIAYFKTISEFENKLKFIHDELKGEIIYCHCVYEIPLGEQIMDQKFVKDINCISRRVYNSTWELIKYTYKPFRYAVEKEYSFINEFIGLYTNPLYFKKNEIVDVVGFMYPNMVTLSVESGLILETPKSLKEIWIKYFKNGELNTEINEDYPEDICYKIISDDLDIFYSKSDIIFHEIKTY